MPTVQIAWNEGLVLKRWLLAPDVLAQPGRQNLRNRVAFVRWFQLPGQNELLAQRIRSAARIHARASKVEKTRHSHLAGRHDDAHSDFDVLDEERDRTRDVGGNPSHKTRSVNHGVGAD